MNWTDEQYKAITLDNSNIIVSAGAGSGKTAVLSERVLTKLKNGVDIDQMLILTFTNAAAKEMKERIRKKITKEPNLASQLDKIDSAYITTFDSYALSIVKKYNYLLNVSKNVSIISSSIMQLKKDEYLDEVFETLYEEKNIDFLKLIDDFCTKDDRLIKNYILDMNNKLDMRYDKAKFLNNYIDSYYSDEYIGKLIKEYEQLLFKKIESINNIFMGLEEYIDSDYYQKCQEIIENMLISKDYEDVKESTIKLPRVPRNTSDEAKKIKEKVNKEIEALQILCIYKDKEEIKNLILKTKDYVRAIINIIKRLDEKIFKYKNETDNYEFSDIAKMAIKVVSENEDVRNELKYSLNEIMIDEYQDTNDIQELFISSLENNNVYMVGDIKQSIYRFRNANPNIFKEKYDNYSLNNGGIKIDLNQNFRSRKEVLQNINTIFEAIMDNDIGGADYVVSHKMEYGNKVYEAKPKNIQDNNLEVLNYEITDEINYSKEEIEIFTVARDIQEKIKNKYQIFDKDENIFRDMKYSDAVILMDRSTNFDLYKKIFEYLNIPLSIYKDDVMNDSVDLAIIKNILSLILNKSKNIDFKYSFISVLRSYLFNMDDAKIFEYFVNKNYDDSELMKIINSIDNSELTPIEVLNEIIEKFKIYEHIITVGNVENHINVLDELINLTQSLTDLGYTISDFYNYLDKIINDPERYKIDIKTKEDKEGVKIMTIHQSKGLEYHICYFTGLYKEFNTNDLRNRFIFDNDYGFITPVFDNGIRPTIVKELFKEKYMKEEISEKIRLFYVALTRAKEKMIALAPLNEEEIEFDGVVSNDIRIKYKTILDILNSIKYKIKPYISNIDLNKLELTKNYNFIKKTNYKENISIIDDKIEVKELDIESNEVLQKHFSKENHKLLNKEQFENINFGKKLHSVFENVDLLNPNYSNISNFEKEKIEKFISTKILDNVINIYKEYEFIYEEDNTNYHGIIDLLLEYDDEFKIVDYKLKNISDEAYLKQLNGYKKYLSTITDKKISIYLYSIIDGVLQKL